MKPVEKALVQFLTNSELSDTDFRAMARMIASGEAVQCVKAAEMIRKTSKDILRHYVGNASSEERIVESGVNTKDAEFANEVFDRTKDLLINEAGLAQGNAIAALAAEFRNVEKPASRSLRTAIEYWLNYVDGSSILSAAQRIRNRIVHMGARHGWPLDDRKD